MNETKIEIFIGSYVEISPILILFGILWSNSRVLIFIQYLADVYVDSFSLPSSGCFGVSVDGVTWYSMASDADELDKLVGVCGLFLDVVR